MLIAIQACDIFSQFYYCSIFEGSTGERILQRSTDLVQSLDSFADCIFDDWIVLVPALVERHVSQFILMTRAGNDENRLLVNYSPALNELIEEARQLTLLDRGGKNLPECLNEVAGRSEHLWMVRARLQDLCEDYNEFQRSTNNFEVELLSEKVKIIEAGIGQCCTIFTWLSFDSGTVDTLYQRIHSLYTQSKEIQVNIGNILNGIEKWGKEPFYYRKDRNPKELLDLQSRPEILRARKMECEKSRRQLSNAVEKNRQLFEVDSSENAVALFEAYLNFVDSEVLTSLKWAVYQNLLYLQHEMQRPGVEPLFEVRVMQKDKQIAFSPSLKDPLDMLSEKEESFIYRIEMIIGDVCSVAELIPRVAAKKDSSTGSFLLAIAQDEDIGDVKRAIRASVMNVIKELQVYVQRFDKYMFLWTDDKDEIMKHAEAPKIDESRENVRE